MENTASNHWHESVDIYCERVSAAFWAEPLNAISNIFFIIAAIMAFRLWQKSASRSWDLLTLSILIAVVGIGSFTFHTIATRWASLADIIPIAIYIHFGLGVFLYRVLKLDLMWAMLGAFGYFLFGGALQKVIPPELMFRSGQYAAAMLLLLLMSVISYIKHVPSAKFFLGSFIVFVISLTFRSIDIPICADFPFGVHYMWHFLNSVVMYLVYKGIISYSHVDTKA